MNLPADDRNPMPHAPRPATDVAAAARALTVLRAGRDARSAKVRRIRQSVRADTYENLLKLSVAADRIVRDLLP